MTTIEWFALLLGIACVGLGVVRSVWTFPTGIGSVALVGVLALRGRLYSDALLQLFYVGANLYGWANWARSREGSGAVVVERMTAAARAAWAGWSLAAAIAWGWTMTHTDAAYPWWDAGVTVASMAAQLLMARRCWENWAVWIAVDVAAVPLYHAKQLDLVAALYVIYLALSLWGLLDWRRAALRTSGASPA